MKKLLVVMTIAAFAGFAWLSLPNLDEAQAPGAGQQTATGSAAPVSIQ